MSALEIDSARPFVEIAGSIFRDGVCLVRSLYAADMIERLAASVAAIYEERDRQAAASELPAHLATDHLNHRAIALDDVRLDGRPARESLVSPLVKSIAGLCLLSQGLVTHPASYFRSALPGTNDTELPFHQDSRILNCELLNLWIPLAACGRDAPGLEVVAQRLYALEPTIPSGRVSMRRSASRLISTE